MPRFSLIVPVYNSQKYLSACLDSLLLQTFDDFEIICVNDGSQDDSQSILDAYAMRDKRIAVFSQQNQGVSVARNTGLAHATGTIVLFIDSDDGLVPHALSVLDKAFASSGAEVITFGLLPNDMDAVPQSLRHELCPRDISYDGFKPALLFKEYSHPYACRTAVVRSLLEREQINFEPGVRLGEDQIFQFVLYPIAQKTALLSDALYMYRMNQDSVTHEDTTSAESRLIAKLEQHYLVEEAIVREWKSRNLMPLAQQDLLEWLLDFILLDTCKLSSDAQRSFFTRFDALAQDGFGKQWERVLSRYPAKRVARKIIAYTTDMSLDSALSFADKALFYVMRRGITRCLERVVMKLTSN